MRDMVPSLRSWLPLQLEHCRPWLGPQETTRCPNLHLLAAGLTKSQTARAFRQGTSPRARPGIGTTPQIKRWDITRLRLVSTGATYKGMFTSTPTKLVRMTSAAQQQPYRASTAVPQWRIFCCGL